MPTTFYARYVPPVANPSPVEDGLEDINPRPKKKKRITDETSTGGRQSDLTSQAQNTTNLSEEHSNGTREATAPKKPKKSKVKASKDYVAAIPAIDDVEDINEDVLSKHKSIKAKYEKASKAALNATRDGPEEPTEDYRETLVKVKPVGIQPLPQPKRIKEEPKSTLSALPVWLTKPIYAKESLPFSKLGLSTGICRRLNDSGFEQAFAVQSAVLLMLLPGSKQHRGDICVSAATGSGKTFAYTLPIIEALKDKPVTRLRALIVVPTRELVSQVQEVFKVTGSSLKVGTAVGSKPLKEEQEALIELREKYDPEAHRKLYDQDDQDLWLQNLLMSTNRDKDRIPPRNYVYSRSSKVDVLICTPGRVVEHLASTRGFTLEHLQWLVIDEADRLLDQSFQQWIDVVIPKLEKKTAPVSLPFLDWHGLNLFSQPPVRKIILSATMTRDYSKLVALDLINPVLVAAESAEQITTNDHEEIVVDGDLVLTSIPEQLKEYAVAVKDAAEKPLYLLQLIQDDLSLTPSIEKPVGSQSINGNKSSITSSDDSTSDSSSDSESDDSNNTSDDSSNESISSSSDSGDSSSESNGSTSSSGSGSDNGSDSEESTDAKMKKREKVKQRPQKDEIPGHGMLIFTSTNETALRLCRLLILLRPSWSPRILPLTKSVGSSSGRKALAAFRRNQADIIVATDLASRGLDLKNLAHVVNYDLPKSLTTYIHRVGRTARAGKLGTATTLVSHHEARWFWNEIGRSSLVDRPHKMTRKEIMPQVSDKERETYESALERLGREAKGST